MSYYEDFQAEQIEELRQERDKLHEQLAKCVERMLELEAEVRQLRGRRKHERLWE